jgi:hypothetical protein
MLSDLIVIEEDKGSFTAVYKSFQTWFMHDTIALEGQTDRNTSISFLWIA